MHHIAIAPDRATLVLQGHQGTHPIHPIWLRERARHPDALDARTEQRLFNPNDLDPDLSVTAIESPEPGQFDLSFSDGVDHIATALEWEVRVSGKPATLSAGVERVSAVADIFPAYDDDEGGVLVVLTPSKNG